MMMAMTMIEDDALFLFFLGPTKKRGILLTLVGGFGVFFLPFAAASKDLLRSYFRGLVLVLLFFSSVIMVIDNDLKVRSVVVTDRRREREAEWQVFSHGNGLF